MTVDRAMLVRYAGASGDFNPIHWSRRAAQTSGLPDVIAHGMLSMALAARVVTEWVVDVGAVREYRLRFSRPLVVPEDDPPVVLLEGRVSAVEEAGPRVTVELVMTCRGVEIVHAAMLVLSPERAR